MLRSELDAVLAVDAGAVPGSTWELGTGPSGLPVAFRPFVASGAGADRPLRIAVAKAPDAGATAATETLLPLVEAWGPRCIAMSGVCAGRRGKTELGDVVAAERLFYRDTGKQLPGEIQQDLTTYKLRDDWKAALEGMAIVERFRDEPWLRARPLPARWYELCALVALRGGDAEPWRALGPPDARRWSDVVVSLRERGFLAASGRELTDAGQRLVDDALFEHAGALPDLSAAGAFQPFRLHVAPLATGAQTVEDEAVWAFISQAMRKTLGFETEAAALGELVHRQRRHRLDAVVMKGVMCFADDGEGRQFEAFAARASAECLLAFLRDQLRPELVAGFDDLLTSGTSSVPSHGRSPSALLLARHTVVPWYDGERREILADLDAWADDPSRAVGVRLLHAGGGVGKTRLAIEWVRRRRERGDVAGFLVPGPGDAWLERLCALGPTVVVVVDYAERRADLGQLFERLAAFAEGRGQACRIRVVLLARSDGDWWTLLRTKSGSVEALLADVVPQRLAQLASAPQDRAAVFREASRVFAALRGRPDVPSPPDLGGPRFDRVLYLHMAALAAVEGSDVDARTLMDVILDHEERFWTSEAIDRDEVAAYLPLARQVMAAATLRGGLTSTASAFALWERLAGRPRTLHDEMMLARLHHLYERANEPAYLPGLEPDLLGEAMVLRVARPPSSKDAVDDAWITRVLILRDDEAALTSAFIVLGRMLDRVPVPVQSSVRMWIRCLLLADLPGRAVLALRAAKKIGEESAYAALGDLLADVLEQHGTGAMAVLLEHEKIPYPTVSLQRVATWRSRKRLQIVASDDVTRARSERAEALAQRGRDLALVGRRHEAVAALQEAVLLYHRLHRQRGEYGSELAASSNNLGIALNDIGKREAALGAVKQAIDLYCGLVKETPTHQPDLARALNNLGAILNALGLHDKACNALEDAVALYSALAAHADEYRPELATCYNNLGAQLTGLGKHAEANAATIRAVKLYRDLASHRHDAFEPDLAWSYHSLGIQLSGLGERRGAVRFACKAVEMYRRLAARNPDAFEAGLATSLNSAGNRAAELGRFDEAFADTREAVERYRRLAARLPDAFRASLALSLVNLANRHSDLRRPGDALAATREAVDIYRVLATPKDEADPSAGDAGVGARTTSHAAPAVSALGTGILRRITITWRPDAFRLELAMSLTQMSQLLHQLRRHEAAVAALRDAVGVYRLLASLRPDAFRPELARSLLRLSHDQDRIGQHDAAIASARDAVDQHRALARQDPDAFQPALATALTHLGVLYGGQGKLTAALVMTVEAVEICRALYDRDRDAFAPDLARSLLSLSSWKSVAQQRSEALDDARHAVSLYRGLAHQAPEAFEPLLASSLQLFALRRRELGVTEDATREAIEATRAAVELYRMLVARHRDELQPALAAALYNLGVLLGERGRREEAAVEIREAIDFLRALASGNPPAARLLVAWLRDLSKRLRDLGRPDEARDATHEADRVHDALQDRKPRPVPPPPRVPRGPGSATTGAPARPQP
ncbi:MAG TPA: tetratricopeptide repeat protein [Kofleriaceae bacterium]|nr:tetratricopeptide repeat protein [Kofleriaceae bacterium]